MIRPAVRYQAMLFFGLLSAILLGGCATGGNPGDPLEPFNRGIYRFNEAVDRAVLKPAAKSYEVAVPQPVKTAVANFFSNINDVLVTFNNLLQLKVERAASDVGRVLANSTLGILGLFDVATSLGLEKHDEDFGQTLGYWGLGNGPYLVLPFFGPSTLRDAFGLAVDLALDPIINGIDDIRVRNAMLALRVVNKRFSLLDAEKILEEAALDPYVFLREAYLQRRRNLVYDGSPPKEEEEEKDKGSAEGEPVSFGLAWQETDTQASETDSVGEAGASGSAVQRMGGSRP